MSMIDGDHSPVVPKGDLEIDDNPLAFLQGREKKVLNDDHLEGARIYKAMLMHFCPHLRPPEIPPAGVIYVDLRPLTPEDIARAEELFAPGGRLRHLIESHEKDEEGQD